MKDGRESEKNIDKKKQTTKKSQRGCASYNESVRAK